MACISDIDTKDFGLICRLCLSEDAKFISPKKSSSIADVECADETETSVEPVLKKLSSITGIQFSEDGVLPQWICTSCFLKVQEVSNFIEMCLQSQLILEESVRRKKSTSQTAEVTEELQTINIDPYVGNELEENFKSEGLDPNPEVDIAEGISWDMLTSADATTCDDCSRSFASKYELTIHRISIHHDDLVDVNGCNAEGMRSCLACRVQLSTEAAFKIHLQSHARKNEQNILCGKLLVVECRYCGSSYLNSDWSGHCETVHKVSKGKQTAKKSFDCKACLRPFVRLHSLSNHIQKHHPHIMAELAEKEGCSIVWACAECNFECFCENELIYHCKDLHEKPPTFRPLGRQKMLRQQTETCECGYIMANPLEDRLHEIFLHLIADGDCPGCELNFSSFQDLQNHVVSYHSFISVGLDCHCLLCEEPCSTFEELKTHLLVEHGVAGLQGDSLSPAKAWKCAKKNCAVTLSATELLEHGRSEHGMEALYHCETCDCCFESTEDLMDHKCSDGDSQSDGSQETDIHVCPTCSKPFPSKMNLHNHFTRRHLGTSRRFVCSFCGKSLKGRVALRSHEDRLHRGVRRFPCPDCSLAFTTASILRKHSELHMAERPVHTCGECGRKFTTVSGYSRHLATHDGNKTFICSMDPCRKAFYTKSELRRHMKFHTQDFEHECDACGHKFVSPGELRKHLTKHTGLRPFQCDICSAKYARRDDKVKHMKRVHHLQTKRIYGPHTRVAPTQDLNVETYHDFPDSY